MVLHSPATELRHLVRLIAGGVAIVTDRFYFLENFLATAVVTVNYATVGASGLASQPEKECLWRRHSLLCVSRTLRS